MPLKAAAWIARKTAKEISRRLKPHSPMSAHGTVKHRQPESPRHTHDAGKPPSHSAGGGGGWNFVPPIAVAVFAILWRVTLTIFGIVHVLLECREPLKVLSHPKSWFDIAFSLGYAAYFLGEAFGKTKELIQALTEAEAEPLTREAVHWMIALAIAVSLNVGFGWLYLSSRS